MLMLPHYLLQEKGGKPNITFSFWKPKILASKWALEKAGEASILSPDRGWVDAAKQYEGKYTKFIMESNPKTSI